MSRIGALIHNDDPRQDDRANGIEVRTVGVPLREGSKAQLLSDGSALTYLNPERVDPFNLCNKAATSLGYTVADDPAAWQRVIKVREQHRKDDEVKRVLDRRR